MKEAFKAFLRMLIPVKLQPRVRAAYKKAFYFGFRYKCPLCNSRLRTFLAWGSCSPVLTEKQIVGGGYRQSALCPVCDSLDRERLLYLYLLRKTDIQKKPKKVLHVAPEAKIADMLRTRTNIDYLTADISSKDVMVKMDVTNIRFPDDAFDVIICNHVLEHVLDDVKAMSELFRTLKRGGWAILQVPVSLMLKNTYEDPSITTEAGREEAFGQGDHVRVYGQDYPNRLARAGFDVDVFKWVAEAENFGGQRNVFGLNEDECVCVVSKRK
jgi:predicted SAM-dependent methyltransferase